MDLGTSVKLQGNGEHNAVNDKVQALGISLQQTTAYFQDVVQEFKNMKMESENLKIQLTRQRKEYEFKTCSGCIELQNMLSSKENIIKLIVSGLTRLNESKSFSIIDEMFKIIFGETTALTPPKDSESFERKSFEKSDQINAGSTLVPSTSTPEVEDQVTSTLNSCVKDESVSEIESTPTGRTSPIIQSKKTKIIKGDPVETGVKKKCSSSWTTPESKHVKMSYPYPSLLKTPKAQGQKVKHRQLRLELVRHKPSHVVDLTSSPDLVGSPRNLQEEENTKLEIIIKKEGLDNDDTILPSPTSGPVRSIFKSATMRSSPQKFIKHEDSLDPDVTRLERSLKPHRARVSPKKEPATPQDENLSQFNTNVSLSLLQQVAQIERDALADGKRKPNSPPKRPLAENINATNLPSQGDSEVSVSVLHRDPRVNKTLKEADPASNKRRSPEKAEDIFKEPTARTKAEKRALPGWSCDECKNFYGELYRDNPEMLYQKMQECSRHRGRRDPARPRTPPNYWNPRWDVPNDTEAFNRRNHAS